ncbi:MAG: GIY-YIG nuclease family protein [Opitutales bacterium]|nr:GIY-YIG nuclease family protein [Opitutales bacterium]
MTYHVYILQNAKGRFYIGHTDDLNRRITQHNSPEDKTDRWEFWHFPKKRRAPSIAQEARLGGGN